MSFQLGGSVYGNASVCRDFSRAQYEVFCCPKRFVLLVCGRRWGKTTLGLYKMLCHAACLPGQICYFIAPTLKQAQETAWHALRDMTPRALVRRSSESRLEIELINRSLLKLHGPESLRGAGLDLAVLDECSFMGPMVWHEIVRPMLADRGGRALLCTTPQGFDYVYDLFVSGQTKSDWAVFQHPTSEGGCVPAHELDLLRETMDPKSYEQEIQASFTAKKGRVYYAFSRDVHVRDVPLVSGPNLLVGMDFNVSQMTAVIAQKVGHECHVSAEIVIPDSNTAEMMQELNRRYSDRKGVVHADPSGCARKTNVPIGITDHAIVEQFGWHVYAPKKPYAVVDRINSVNAMFLNRNGNSRLYIDSGCHTLIRALENQTYKEGTRTPEKGTGFDNIVDALGYLIMGVFPMIEQRIRVSTVLI